MPLGNLQLGNMFQIVGVNETVLTESERILKLLLDTRQVRCTYHKMPLA
jgi:hypothetical protein